MDPSEFEGTIPQESDILHAGSVLEGIFGTINPIVNANLCLEAFNERRQHLDFLWQEIENKLNPWKDIQYSNQICIQWDEVIIKITDLRDEYSIRRKALVKTIREFQENFNIQNDNVKDMETIHTNIISLIETFKKEYDFISTSYKFVENSFLMTYKQLRDLPDPILIIQLGFDDYKNEIDFINKCKSQIDMIITFHQNEQSNKTYSQEDSIKIQELHDSIDKLQLEHQKEIDSLRYNHNQEILELKKVYDNEFHSKIDQHRNQLEHEYLTLQSSMEKAISSKDNEISSLLQTLEDTKAIVLEAKQNDRQLSIEISKKRDLEDKLHSQMIDISELQQLKSDLILQSDQMQAKMNLMETNFQRQNKELHHKLMESEEVISTLQSQLERKQFESEPQSHPMITSLMSKLQSYCHQLSNNEDKDFIDCKTWLDLEERVVNLLRSSHSSAAELRVKYQELLEISKTQQNDLDQCKLKLQEKMNLIASLERDLSHALKSKQLHGYSPSNTKYASAPNRMLFPLTPSKTRDDDKLSAELEAILLTSASTTSPIIQSKHDRGIVSVLENQRDRFVQQNKEKDTEISLLQSSLIDLQEERNQLKNENLELYRRLRHLRLNSKINSLSNNSDFMNSFSEYRLVTSSDGLDDIDMKYDTLYENQIDPFYIEEFDRNQVISKLNIFERSLATLTKMFLQDSMTRKVLLVYLLLVHLFALGYVVQILNPQLIEEVDSINRMKYTSYTMDFINSMDAEHIDNAIILPP